LSGLDLGPGDRADLQGIGDDDPMDERREQPDNDCRVAGGFENHVVRLGQHLLREEENSLSLHGEPAMIPREAVLEDRDLREAPMDI
jgi:hypothetical protein